MTDASGTVPVLVRCGCVDRRVPLHLYKGMLQLLAEARKPPEYPVALHRCRKCGVSTIVRVSDLPVIRLAS